jgi:hypothetical protein
MSGYEIGQSVQVKGRDGTDTTGTIISWDDTRQQYLVRVDGDEGQHYFASDELATDA